MITANKSNRGIIIAVGMITLIIIIIIVIADVVMWATNKGLYKPYVPPPTPAGSVAPNGNSSDAGHNSNNVNFSKALLANIQNNMNNYKNLNPATDSLQFGYFS
jgi:hypothetical protein